MSKMQQHDSGKILLAVDGSPSAKAAAYAAAQIAAKMQWSLHAIYVVDATQVFEIYGDTSQELSEFGHTIPHRENVELFEEQGTLALAEVQALCQGYVSSITTEMFFGGIPEIILQKSVDYNLLALGRVGNRQAKDARHLGSNFQQIAHQIHQPLLIGSREDTQRREMNRAVLAYDGGKLSCKALAWTERLQEMFTKVTAVSVNEEDEQDNSWLEQRRSEIAESGLPHLEFIPETGEPGKKIVSTALSRQADLVLMGTHRRTKLFGWGRRSAFETVLRETDLTILSTP